MSNPEGGAERSARRHPWAIWGIVVALAMAALALLVFGFLRPSDVPGEAVAPPAAVTTAPAPSN